jgi:hypothetical protein
MPFAMLLLESYCNIMVPTFYTHVLRVCDQYPSQVFRIIVKSYQDKRIKSENCCMSWSPLLHPEVRSDILNDSVTEQV